MSTDLEFQAPSIEELQPHFPAYEINTFIAAGGMGAVYAARQVSLDRPVAIKILPRQFGADPQFRSSFESEAKSMARLNHPNLIGVYDFGDADGMLYIIMELVEGKSLHHSAYGRAIDQSEAARLVAGISHGLAHAHQHGILHRDIKPGNILLGPGAVPKIGDFGLARPVGADHNPDEIVWGTPGYSAPEVVNNPGAVDQRADIFAIGVLLYELLTAQIPPDPWKPPSTLSQCSPEFDAIVRRATHPSPELRYSDAEELAKALDELGEKFQKPVLRRTKTGAPGATTAPAGRTPIGVRPGAPALGSSQSKSTPILITVLVVAVLAVGGLIIASSGNKKTKEQAGTPSAVEEPDLKPDPKPDRNPGNPLVERGSNKTENEPEPVDPEPPAPEPPTPEPEESTTQALTRLKAKLKAGDLSNLPKGTVKRGDSHFLLVDNPLGWPSASRFAEDHGAQLATLESKDELAWASTEFKLSVPTWVGLSDSGTEGSWYWVNGRPPEKSLWAVGQPDNTNSRDGGENYAALLPDHSLDDLAASRPLPFLLQWGEDGNEGSIASQLKRVAASLKAKRPIFPAGTRNISGSRFLVIPQSVSWADAQNMAIAAGGHLAVPSTDEEAAWILKTMESVLGGGDGCWIGGRQQGVASPRWTFVTGERFDFVSWAPGQPDEEDGPQPSLQVWRGVDSVFGYNNASGEAAEANYFLVEWSAPSRRNMPRAGEANAPADAGDWLVKFRQDFHDREKVAYERWQRRHEKNVEDFANDIESEADTARRANRALKDLVDNYIDGLKDRGEVPATLGNPLAERAFGKVHDRALAKQKKIWDDYQADFEDAQQRYIAQLEVEIKRRAAQGDREGVSFLKPETVAATDNDYFLAILNGESPEPPVAEDEDE